MKIRGKQVEAVTGELEKSVRAQKYFRLLKMTSLTVRDRNKTRKLPNKQK